MRINKYIAEAGVASRRKADDLIRAGAVRVNGVVLTRPGYDVQKGDEVTVKGARITPHSRKVYYMLNKPTGVITSVSDPEGRLTVVDLIPDAPERIFPVGRLDYQTSGLLFLTNDGEFAQHISHPKHQVGKVYRVRVPGEMPRGAVERLRRGVDIGGFVTSPARVERLQWTRHSTLLEIEIHEGKNRQVRRMLRAVGFDVQELERIAVGKITLGRLKTGSYRKLSPQEVRYLMEL